MDASSRRSSSLVAAGMLLSRVAGLVRQRAFGHFFGVGPVADAFSAAIRIPNLLQNMLGEGVLSASFIPVYARLMEEGDHEEAGAVAGATAGLLAMLAAGIAFIGVVFAAPITDMFTWGFGQETRDLTVRLVRLIFPGVGFLVLSAWCLGILNSHRRFFLSYVSPVLWNVAQISALLAFGIAGVSGERLAVVLAWSVMVGSALQFGLQLPSVRRLVPALRVSADFRRHSVRRVVKSFAPIVGARGIVQITSFVNLIVASFLAAGAVAAITFAQTLYLLPVGLFGMSVAVVELPELSRASVGALDVVTQRLEVGLARVAFFVVGSVVAFTALGDYIVGVLFATGAFGPDDVRLVWLVVSGYCVGLVAVTSSRLYQSALYGMGDTRTPAIAVIARVAVSTVVGLVLMLQLDRVVIDGGRLVQFGGLPALAPLPESVRSSTEFRHLGAVGLSLATGIASWLENAIMRRKLRTILGRDVRPGGGYLIRNLAAGIGAAMVAIMMRPLVSNVTPVVALLVAGIPTALVYISLTWRLGVPECRVLVAAVWSKVASP